MGKKTKLELEQEKLDAEIAATEAELEIEHLEKEAAAAAGEGIPDPAELAGTDDSGVDVAGVDEPAATSDVGSAVEASVKKSTILLEDGSRIERAPGQGKLYRLQDTEGRSYDHCSDTLDGEWVYRKA